MKRYQIRITRVGDAKTTKSLSNVEMILEDNTDDDIHTVCDWAETYIDTVLPGYHVSEVMELG